SRAAPWPAAAPSPRYRRNVPARAAAPRDDPSQTQRARGRQPLRGLDGARIVELDGDLRAHRAAQRHRLLVAHAVEHLRALTPLVDDAGAIELRQVLRHVRLRGG